MSASTANLEALSVRIKLKKCRPILCVRIYRPPYGKMYRFTYKISELLDNILSHASSEVIVLEYFNIDFHRTNSWEMRSGKDLCDAHDLHIMINESTRMTDVKFYWLRSDTLQQIGNG